MITGWSLLLGTAGAVLSCVSFWLYARDVLIGEARPNLVSFALWTAFEAIVLAAQLSTGFTLSAVFLATLTLGTGGIAVLAACGWGYAKYGRLEAVCVALWAAGIAIWAGAREPLAAVLFSVGADMAASLPTVRKAWRDPRSESFASWLVMPAAAALTLAATRPPTIINIAFPVWILVLNATVATIIAVRRGHYAPNGARNPARRI